MCAVARPFTINDAAAWERQTGESDESWEAFVLYRDMPAEGDGRRSTRAVARQLGKDRTLIGRWSAGHEWQLRVQAFDREQDARRLAEQAQAFRRAARRQGRALEAAVTAVLQPVEAYLRKLHEDGGPQRAFADWDLRELSVASREAVKLLPALVRAERLVHGLSTSKGETVAIDPERAAAEARVRDMDRGELDAYLLGVDEGSGLARGSRAD